MASTSVSAAANAEFDATLKKMVYFLHSNNPSSATELRQIVDEAIKQRAGAEKMLCITLSQRHLELENNFPGMMTTPPEIQDEVINLTNSPKTISDSPDTIIDSDDAAPAGNVSETVNMLADSDNEDDGNLKDFGDLNCCVCGQMVFTATNRLIECSKCSLLYHQECHKPTISDEEASEDHENNWQCDSCSNKPTSSRAASANVSAAAQAASVVIIDDEPMPLVAKSKSSAASSSSSNSSSPFYKHDQPSASVAGSSGKHHHKERSSSSSGKHHKSSHSSKSSSSKSSSRHHDSKRKSKQ